MTATLYWLQGGGCGGDTWSLFSSESPDIPEFLAEPDETYLITRPGDSVQLGFDVGESEHARTFFLVSEGYYMEWMRSEWLAEEHRRKFRPGPDALVRSLKLYAQQRDTYRERFESIKVPVQ